jgi:hypothetical protein
MTINHNIGLIWDIFKHINPQSAWGDPGKMNRELLVLLEFFGASLPVGCWIKIHKGYKEGEKFYEDGNAAAFHVVGCSFIEAEKHLNRFLHDNNLHRYLGLGLYPDWSDPGFSIDIRGKKDLWAKMDGKWVDYSEALTKLGAIK